MENQRISIIGGGNMPEAILRGMAGAVPPENITVCDIDAARRTYLLEKYGVRVTAESAQAVLFAPVVLMAVKPDVCGRVLAECGELMQGKALVSIVAGWSCASIAALLPDGVRILRVMPNTPALVGEGMSVFCTEHTLEADEYAFIESIFASFGRVMSLPERYFDAVTALSGSGPAYVFLFIEALADGGVKQGLPRAAALELAAQTVLGAARMVLDSGRHPGELKDAVCSPGGTTIEAVFTLEKSGFRGAVMDAVEQCARKSKSLH
jgi:pyrroline-5-carboxylate reductase